NLLRAAALVGAVGGIALLAQDRRPATPHAVAPVEPVLAHAAPAAPVVALEKPAAEKPVEKAAEKPAEKPAAPVVAEKKPVSSKKSLRELAKRSRHHEAIARILLE